MSSKPDNHIPWDVLVKLCNEAIAEELETWGSPIGHTFTQARSTIFTDDEGNKFLGIDVDTDCPDAGLNTFLCMTFSSMTEARWKRKCLAWRREVVLSN